MANRRDVKRNINHLMGDVIEEYYNALYTKRMLYENEDLRETNSFKGDIVKEMSKPSLKILN